MCALEAALILRHAGDITVYMPMEDIKSRHKELTALLSAQQRKEDLEKALPDSSDPDRNGRL